MSEPTLYQIDKMSHNDVRDAAELLGVSIATMAWAIDIILERLMPVEPDYEAAWKAWKATGNIEDAVDAALGIGGDYE